MSYGKRSAWQRPHDAVYSSRAPSVERERPLPCSALRPEPQDCAEVIYSAPEIAELPVDLHEQLIQKPPPLGIAVHVRCRPLSDLGSKHRTKPVPPKPDRLMADVDPALGPEILDVARRERESHVHHHDQTDHFWRAVEKSERVAHDLKLQQPKTARKITLSKPGRGRHSENYV
jgi:hypothetical protein